MPGAAAPGNYLFIDVRMPLRGKRRKEERGRNSAFHFPPDHSGAKEPR